MIVADTGLVNAAPASDRNKCAARCAEVVDLLPNVVLGEGVRTWAQQTLTIVIIRDRVVRREARVKGLDDMSNIH